ncbi:hypothetical protein GDO78_018921 [Eleutherodactylus coqui]|uniref:Uncharacterized protein n=1 Tax=Eleutherodactylus coqui TaxID=57060 RepID=A0A8J6JZV4_ELECQ|nr:hypothetical protein GDO78_018921 [Eleutherodactylus coqui]
MNPSPWCSPSTVMYREICLMMPSEMGYVIVGLTVWLLGILCLTTAVFSIRCKLPTSLNSLAEYFYVVRGIQGPTKYKKGRRLSYL